MNTEAKVRKIVREVLPKGRKFRIAWQPVGKRYRVLRVITPAWRSLPRFERILKMREAIASGLTLQERKNIFRVSVLTAKEYEPLRRLLPPAPRAAARGKRRT